MLISASKLSNYPVLSLHVGGEIAQVKSLIIDPAKLQIIAFQVDGLAIRNDPEVGDFLESRDVREFASIGMIIDSSERLVNSEDVVKLKEVLALDFGLIGLKVETKKGSNLGKITDFTVETDTFKIKQLIVRRPVLKAIIDPELTIPRKEIIEVADDKIVVKDEEEKIRTRALKDDFVPNFVNPFREPDFSNRKTVQEEHEQ